MLVRNLERLGVDLTESPDAVSVDRRAAVVDVFGQEGLELALDGALDGEVGHPLGQVRSLDILERFERKLLVHDVGVHVLVGVLVVSVSATAGLCGEINVAVFVLARQEGRRDALAARHLSVSAVELSLEATPVAEVQRFVVSIVIDVEALVAVVLLRAVIMLETLSEEIDVIFGHLIDVVKIVLQLGLLLNVVVILRSVGSGEGRRGRRHERAGGTCANRRSAVVAAGARTLAVGPARRDASVGGGHVGS